MAQHKSKKQTKSKSMKKTRSKSNRINKAKLMRGGDDGRYVLPGAYFNKGDHRGYYPAGSSQLNARGQHAVSQGTISKDGTMAGPNLFPSMAGGGCGCRKQKNSKSSKKTKKNSKKQNKRS